MVDGTRCNIYVLCLMPDISIYLRTAYIVLLLLLLLLYVMVNSFFVIVFFPSLRLFAYVLSLAALEHHYSLYGILRR